VLADGESRPQTKTLHAGEGFLGQSSKWVHFGLNEQELSGQSPLVKVHVRWPGGASEDFSGVEPDGWYRLTQGSGRAEPVVRTPVSMAFETTIQPAKNGPRRVLLSARVPSPTLRFEDFQGQSQLVPLGQGRPVLLNLWASWCLPCLRELSDWKSPVNSRTLDGLDIVALSVDKIDANVEAGADNAAATIAQLELPFPHGLATVELYARLEQLMNWPFRRKIPVPVPVSLLFDGQGQLAAIYRGPVDAPTLASDVAKLSLTPSELRMAALPFGGRWDQLPQPLRPIQIAIDLMDKGDVVDAAEFVRSNFELLAPHKEFGLLSVWLADEFVKLDRTREAISYYEWAVSQDPDNITVLNNLAWQLAAHADEKVRDPRRAVVAAEKAARLTKHENPHVLDTLAVAYAASGDFAKAIQIVERAQKLVTKDALLTAKFTNRLQLFRNQTMYRDPPVGRQVAIPHVSP
jgi:tetratricopeptide (TPR) repeat protein